MKPDYQINTIDMALEDLSRRIEDAIAAHQQKYNTNNIEKVI